MSGPKVINIEAVRRRQKREGQVMMRKLQLAVAECERWQAQSSAADSMKRLEAFRETEQWEALLLESERLHDFYHEEVHRLREQHASEQTTRLRRAHRLQLSVTQMTGQLQKLPPSEERDAFISQLAGSDSTQHESAINASLYFIGRTQPDQNIGLLRELASSFIDSDAKTSTPALPRAPADPQQIRLEKCWQLLGELATGEQSSEIEALSAKARLVTTTPEGQQALLLDSLALELSTHLQHQRATRDWREELEILLTQLDEIRSSVAAEWRQRITAALTQSTSPELNSNLLSEARAWIDQIIAEEIVEEQRAAVLRALAAIGYEVREGMAAAWVEQGRIVLRKPSESIYGVELSAPAQGSIIQSRLVAFGDARRDAQRDREVEETWCGEFERARIVLDEAGFQASLLHAHSAGSIPLKTIAIPLDSGNKRQSLELRKSEQRMPEK